MSDEPDNIVLIYLRRLVEEQRRIADDISDIKRRTGHVEESVATMATGYAGLQLRMDRIDGRLERIERRLDMHDARV